MPRLLIVSPHFPPVNTPDMQRVRMSLPHFVDAGWEIVVLVAADHEPQAPLEPDLLTTVPSAVRIVSVRVISRRWSRYAGVNNLGWRGLPFFYSVGRELLEKEAFDLVYFSTTQFIVCALGRLWNLEFATPYVIDLQDPWLSDYYDQPGAPRPPGGWKYKISHGLAKVMEGWTMRRTEHVISVSEHYLQTLQRRYPWFGKERGTVLTFGAPDEDFAVARAKVLTAPALLPKSQTLKIVYAGRLGPDMLPALDVLFAAIAQFKSAAVRYELFFYGTSYAPAGKGKPSTAASAAKHGITELVHEQTARMGYIDSLRAMLESDLTLLLGSEDKAYSPSKVYPTLLAGRPTVAVAPRESVLQTRIAELGGAEMVLFPTSGDTSGAVERLAHVLVDYAANPQSRLGEPPRLDLLRKHYTAAAIARRQMEVFNRLIIQRRGSVPVLSAAEYWPTPPARSP